MQSAIEDAVVRGPEYVQLALVWPRDEHAVALIHLGWFVDYYDFSEQRGDSFGAGLIPQADTNALLVYHSRIAGALGADVTRQVIKE
jgi:hypothetical protein